MEKKWLNRIFNFDLENESQIIDLENHENHSLMLIRKRNTFYKKSYLYNRICLLFIGEITSENESCK